MTTRELVDALISGDSVAIDTTFDTVMTQKVSSALDDLRVSVATNMFNPQEETVEELELEQTPAEENQE
jgi:hypothetical protein